jgi:hypothetical protein
MCQLICHLWKPMFLLWTNLKHRMNTSTICKHLDTNTFNYKREQCKQWHSININIDIFIYLWSNFTMQLLVGNFFFNYRFWMQDIVLSLTLTNMTIIIGLKFIPCFMFNCGEGQVSWLTLFSNHLRTFLDG